MKKMKRRLTKPQEETRAKSMSRVTNKQEEDDVKIQQGMRGLNTAEFDY